MSTLAVYIVVYSFDILVSWDKPRNTSHEYYLSIQTQEALCSVLPEQSLSRCCTMYTCSLLYVSQVVLCRRDSDVIQTMDTPYMLCINTIGFLVAFFSRQLRSQR